MLRYFIVVLFLLNAVENNVLKGLAPVIPFDLINQKVGGGNQQTAIAGSTASTNNGKGGSATSASYAVANTSGDKATAATYTYAASKGKGKEKALSKGIGTSKAFGDSKNSAATSKSASHSITKDKDGTHSASSLATAEAMKIGGKNGIGIALAATASNAVTKKKDGKMTVSTGAVTTSEISIAGKKIKTPMIKTPPMKYDMKIPMSKSDVLGLLKKIN